MAPSTPRVRSEAIPWRYEIGYCPCRHKVLSDIMRLPHGMPVLLSDLKRLYFCTDDAEEAFLVRIKDPRSRISGRCDVANRRPELGCQILGKQRGRDNVRSRYSLRNCDDDFLAGQWGILTHRHSTKSQADWKLLLVHREEGQVHVTELAFWPAPGSVDTRLS